LRLEFIPRALIDLGAKLGAAPAQAEHFATCRDAIILELQLTAQSDLNRWIAYPRDRNAYRLLRRYFGKLWSYGAVTWAIDTLFRAGLIEHDRTWPSATSRLRSAIRATPKLLAISPMISLDDLIVTPSELIRLKDFNRKLAAYRETRPIHALRLDVQMQNEALSGLAVACASSCWQQTDSGCLSNGEIVLNPLRTLYYRVFNGDFQYGGRWYGPWWQGLPVKDRQYLTINGEQVVEVDYKHIHPTLISALIGRELGDDDPYQIDGFARSDIKRAFNVLINASTERAAALALRQVLAEQDHEAPGKYAKALIQEIKLRHANFEGAFGSGCGIRLQAIDAGMCSEVQRVMRDLGHPVLSVHDSFIVTARQKQLLKQTMQDVLERTKQQLAGGEINVRLTSLK
jgi:hypothetical protein